MSLMFLKMSKRHLQVETTEAMLDSRRNVMACDIGIVTSNCGLLNSDNIITDRITCERIWSPTSPKRPMTIAFSPLDQSTISGTDVANLQLSIT